MQRCRGVTVGTTPLIEMIVMPGKSPAKNTHINVYSFGPTYKVTGHDIGMDGA